MKKIVAKTFKYFLFTVLGLLITVNLFIVLSGRFYLYKGVANTYLVGKTGPSIYDLEISPYSTVKSRGYQSFIPYHEAINTYHISDKQRELLESLETKAFLVFKGGTLMYEEYWDSHDAATVSNSFSVAKTLVAILIGIAIDEGHIKNLDEPVATYLPEFKNKEKGVITIRHLLEMASGLDWSESSKDPLSNNAESYYGSDLKRLVMNQKSVTNPGEVFIYQSGNSQLLGMILEEATGQDLTKYAEEKVWKKIGAEHEAYWSLDRENGDEKAFCCLYAVARDYGRIGQLFLNKGKFKDEQIIPEWYYNEMVAESDLSTEDGIPNTRYGLHIWKYNHPDGQVNYCRGVNGQYIIAQPDQDLLIVRLGEKRLPTLTMEDHKLDPKKVTRDKIGHTFELFEYLRLGKEINLNTGK